MYGYISDDQIVQETEKALKFEVLIETYSGRFIKWNLWLPKKVYYGLSELECLDGKIAREVDNFCLKLWDGKLPNGAKEIR